jgi:outer membrane protein, heavy metal efflux system
MIDEAPREASYTIPLAAIKLVAAAALFTLVMAGYPSQATAYAATSGQSVQEAAPQSERPATQSDHSAHQTPTAQAAQNTPAGPVMTLADIERMAMQNNPTLAQAESAIRAAEGRRRQAGLWPNPIVGYQGEEFAFRAFSQKSEHFAFIEQTIPLGGKLSKSQRILEREIAQSEIEATAQKQRVLNTVRMLYYEVLGAQQLVDLRTELAKIARDATKTTSELLNVGQADRPDYLESEIETQQVELGLESAKNNLRQVQQSLATVVGTPGMEPALLAGTLEEGIPTLDQDTLTATLMRESPDVKRAKAGVELAQAVLARAKAERVPDLFLRGGVGYNTEFLESRTGATGMRTGPEANVQVGITLPIFNRNQGGIATAEAEIVIAEREVRRTELALRVRLAQAFRDYNNAVDAVRRYREVIVPRAERAYNLYLASFRQMAASYPQVLISQRTMFQVREHYLNALVDLRQNAIQIEGFLLTGGLDAPRMRTAEGERLEIRGARSSSKSASDQFEDRER